MTGREVGQWKILLAAMLWMTLSVETYAQIDPAVIAVRSQWEQVNYLSEDADREKEYLALLEKCEMLNRGDNATVEIIIWCGIVKSTYAGSTSGLGALKYAKQARVDMERSLDLDDDALDGAASTTLGTLYARVPGWPLGFGDEKKARHYLLAGLAINPGGIEGNYFYAEFLYGQGEYDEARKYLDIASKAKNRPGRAVSDNGRRIEIEILQKKLNAQ
jgi:tetratricopeptide (TPR) repeat protein